MEQQTAKQLPEGYFLICGDRAWQGIPKNVIGGLCYIGKLTMFVPSMRQLLGNRTLSTRAWQSITQLGPTCDDNIQLIDNPTKVLLAILVPGATAGKALKTIDRLACWTAKQLNITSDVLSELTEDIDSIRHAVLQNRAAIDFLLLAQGHGCEDFEGMCRMSLSDHSHSIHKQL